MNFESIPGPFVIAVIAFTPFLVVLTVAIMRASRRKRELEARASQHEPPFMPEPLAANPLLARFDSPRQAWLRQLIPTVRASYITNTWVFFVVMSSGLLPQFIHHIDPDQTPSQRIWSSFLLHFAASSVMLAVIAFIAAFLALSLTLIPAQSQFYRTRPVTRAFLFWAGIGPVLAGLLAALVTAAALSFLLLRALYGPVWRLSYSPGIPACDTSPLLLILSSATTIVFIFGLGAMLFNVPVRTTRMKLLLAAFSWILIVAYSLSTVIAPILSARFASLLFLYNHLGPAPPAGFALVPLALSACFLLIAQQLFARKET